MDECKILYQMEEEEVTFAFFDDDVQILPGNCAGYVHTRGIISYDRYGNITGCRSDGWKTNCSTN